MTIIRALFPMAFGVIPCMKCSRPIGVEDGLPEFDAEGKVLGLTCWPECPRGGE